MERDLNRTEYSYAYVRCPMALSRRKYRRLPDLYVTGKELVCKDGTLVWMQALNPFEQDEARHDAMVARARMVMALQEHGSDELAKVRSVVIVDGRDTTIDNLVDTKQIEALMNATDAVANDPLWKERMEITTRQDEILARDVTDPERALLDQINREYIIETNRLVDEEIRGIRARYEALGEAELVEEYIRYYVERRGTDVALAEHKLTEIWYSTRCCDAERSEDGAWNHDNCEGHTTRVFETKAEVRELPGDLQDLLANTVTALNMTVREAKNSDRQGSSSASSPLPSEEGESIPSIPDATQTEPRGSSPRPSLTP